MSGPQPWKGNTYSKGQGLPFQPRETPVQRRLRRKHGEKQVEERTSIPKKIARNASANAARAGETPEPMTRSGAAMNAQNSNASSHAVGSSNLKNRTANPTRRNGIGNNPMTCSAEDLARPSPALFGDL